MLADEEMTVTFRDTVEEFWDDGDLQACCDRARTTSVDEFVRSFRDLLGTSGSVNLFPSARMALSGILRSEYFKRGSKVLISSFNCAVVAEAITAAGLEVETFDASNRTGAIDWVQLAVKIHRGHSAIVVPHLFGVPADFRAILAAADRAGAIIIEDCAHTLGAKIGARTAGTIGDAAIFSFNFDKPISLGGGGILLLNNTKFAGMLNLQQSTTDYETEFDEISAFRHSLNFRRNLFGHEGWWRSQFRRGRRLLFGRRTDDGFCKKGIGPIRAALGVHQINRYQDVVLVRNRNAENIRQMFPQRTWNVDRDVKPAWLRQKVTFEPGSVAAAINEARAMGVRIGRFNWPRALDGRGHCGPKRNADSIASCSLDIPIHQNMTSLEIETLKTVISNNP
jgi:dTDP-4-amino-4,6-dideoxygalactose transaminase